MLDVCICTHNPRVEILSLSVRSIAEQQDSGQFNVLIVDNNSDPPVDPAVLAPLHVAGISARIVRELDLGIANARKRAIEETSGGWLIFVDDDNELSSNYIAEGLRFAAEGQDVGCFGGKLLLAPGLQPPDWATPFLPYLGIKDLGERTLVAKSDCWTECEPPTAGAWIRRDVAQLYAERLRSDPQLRLLGRRGRGGLLSSEDSLMMRGSNQLGLANAYCPRLSLYHHLSPARFAFPYLLNLMAGYGESQLLLEKKIIGEHPLEHIYEDPEAFSAFLDGIFFSTQGGRMRAGQMMWHIAAQLQHGYDAVQDAADAASITLVTPCLNAAPTIARTLESIAQQNYPNLQYIVCDGGSSDGTLDILKEYEHMIDVLIVGKDKNVADALNKGFAEATGEIRGYLNADDCLVPGALQKVASIFRHAPDIDVVTGSCHRWFADGTDLITKVPDRYVDVMALRNDIEQPSTFWRREIQGRAGPFDDRFKLAFDWEYWNRLKSVGAKFHRTEKLLSVYYFTDTNLTSRAGATVIDEMYLITKKYAGAEVADAYMQIFEQFDMKGYYDVPFQDLPPGQRQKLGRYLNALKEQFGENVVNSYNWNWASKQIRGVKWY